ncbi:hypothetical protein MHYP_G00002630 [Metynnis hypsauchen]
MVSILFQETHFQDSFPSPPKFSLRSWLHFLLLTVQIIPHSVMLRSGLCGGQFIVLRTPAPSFLSLLHLLTTVPVLETLSFSFYTCELSYLISEMS